MSPYISNIRFSVLTFPLLALVCTVPYMIFQYRRFGRIPFWKTLTVYAFIFYVTTAYYMVVLPLPADRTAYVAYAAAPQLVPFAFVRTIAAETSFSLADPSTWLATLKNPDVYEAFFNLLLTVPLGIFLRYFFKCRWWVMLVVGFLMALFYETSQLTGLWGIYAHPYRLFDVDDLIVNTTGAMVGFWLAGPLTRYLPDIDELNEESLVESATYTSFTRRLLAFALDLVPVALAFVVAEEVAPGSVEDLTFDVALLMGTTGILFMLVPALTGGATLGDAILHLRIVRPDGSPARRWQPAVRYVLLLWVFLLLPAWLYLLLPDSVEGEALPSDLFVVAVLALYATWGVSVVVRAVRSALHHPFVMLNGIVSGTRVMSAEQIDALRGSAGRHARKEVRVAAAVIVRDGAVLATQRGYGDMKGGWEFPGGKVEQGETGEQTVRRELREELAAEVSVGRLVCVANYDYDDFHLDMCCYLCRLEGDFTLLEHTDARWLDAEHLRSVGWLPADGEVLDAIEAQRIL